MADTPRDSEDLTSQDRPGEVDPDATKVQRPPRAPLPERISHYRIKSVLGSGGMGTVYLAIQEQPRRRVALKIMKRGIASRSALRRFEYEAQILARLRHAHIAQVYEAGTHDDGSGGVPYFAMEYVPNARPITDHARENSLDVRARLELIIQVCDAVHHGHQKGIIHRDLKPENILVDSNGEPKIIDFGVARATDSDLAVTTLQTDLGQIIGTLQYMSPEQCEADSTDLDTRSDVYALGVVLYELLCERLPYDVTSVAVYEAARVIRETPPARPSTLNRALRGDVETIVMRALEKDRERRYQSATDFAQDIQRYLNREPIEARPPSLFYQMRIFARRNRGAVIAMTTIVAVLIVATLVSIVFAVQANLDRRRADAETANAEFRMNNAREDVARAVDELGRLQRLARRGQDFEYFVPEHIRAQYPDDVFPEFDAWLGELFPELGPTTFDSVVPQTPLPDGIEELLATYIDAPDDPQNGPLYDWIQRNHGRMQQLVDQLKARDPVVVYHWQPERSLLAGLMPALRSRRLAGRYLGAHAITLHRDGRYEDAIDVLRAQQNLSRASRSSGSFVSSLIGIALRNTMYDLLRWMIMDQVRHGDHPGPYIQFMIEDPPISPIDFDLRIDAMIVRQSLRELFVLDVQSGQPRLDPEMWEETLKLVEDPAHAIKADLDLHAIDLHATLQAFDDAVDAYLRLADEPRIELTRSDPPEVQAIEQRDEVLGILLPSYTNALKIHARHQMNRDATIITAALAAFRFEHGTWPTTIDDALAGFPAQPLRRDYFGADFIYRIKNDAPVLYSVGTNQSDDGGDDSGRPPLDYVFLRPRP